MLIDKGQCADPPYTEKIPKKKKNQCGYNIPVVSYNSDSISCARYLTCLADIKILIAAAITMI
jgi:hypothetical protein